MLHLYTKGVREQDQAQTWDLLEFCTWPEDLHIIDCPCPDPMDMSYWLQRYWLVPGDLLTLEHDILATPDHVAELRACPEPVCAYDALLAHGVSWTTVPMGGSLGLWRATEAARRVVPSTPQVPQVPFTDLGGAMCQTLGEPHPHRPLIGHNHYL